MATKNPFLLAAANDETTKNAREQNQIDAKLVTQKSFFFFGDSNVGPVSSANRHAL